MSFILYFIVSFLSFYGISELYDKEVFKRTLKLLWENKKYAVI